MKNKLRAGKTLRIAMAILMTLSALTAAGNVLERHSLVFSANAGGAPGDEVSDSDVQVSTEENDDAVEPGESQITIDRSVRVDPIRVYADSGDEAYDFPPGFLQLLRDKMVEQSEEAFDVSAYGVPVSAASYVNNALSKTYPIEWALKPIASFSYSYASSGSDQNILQTFRFTYRASSDGLSYSERYDKLMSVMQPVLDEVRGMSDFNKIIYVHDHLVKDFEYDNSLTKYTAYEILTTGSGVCSAYSQAFKLYMDVLCIPCEYAESPKMDHAWNMVYLEGNWYHMDVTWDDPLPDTPNSIHWNINTLLNDEEIQKQAHYDWTSPYISTSTAFSAMPRNGSSQQYAYRDKWYLLDADNRSLSVCDKYGSHLKVLVNNVTGAFGGYKDMICFSEGDQIKAYWIETGHIGTVYTLSDEEQAMTSYPSRLAFRTFYISTKGQLTYQFDTYTESGNLGIKKGLNTVNLAQLRKKTVNLHAMIDALPDTVSNQSEAANADAVMKVYGAMTDCERSNIDQSHAEKLEKIRAALGSYFPVAAESVTVSPESIYLHVGESETLTAVVRPPESTDIPVWSSSDESVAVVSGGKVTAVGEGNAVITVRAGNFTATCSVTSVDEGISLSISTDSIKLGVGETKKITATVVPNNLTSDVVWVGSDEAVAVVDNKGNVTGIGPGQATVSAVLGDIVSECSVRVDIKAEKVIIERTMYYVKVGETIQLNATVTPSNTTESCYWGSGYACVSVTSDGRVTGVSPGSATVYMRAGDVSATCRVIVDNDSVPPETVKVYGEELYQEPNSTIHINSAVTPSTCTNSKIWTSSDESVATVSSGGYVTTHNPGTAVITLTCGNLSDSCILHVTENVIHADSLSVVNYMRMAIGEQEKLKIMITPANTTDYITYSSDRTDIATVDENGVVTAVKDGTARITASIGSLKSTSSVTVYKTAVPVESVTFYTKEYTLQEGDTLKPDYGVLPFTHTQTIEWSSSDPSVAIAFNDQITGIAPGTAVITLKAGDFSATCKVTVTKKPVPATGITLSKQYLEMNKGEQYTLTATVKPDGCTDEVEWSSSDTSIATVTNGVVTAVGTGKVYITAKAGTEWVDCTIDVYASATNVTISKKTLRMTKGSTTILKATVTPEDSSDGMEWSSSDTNVVIADGSLIKAVGNGTAIVTVKAGDVSDSCTVTVTTPATGVTLSQTSVSLEKGEKVTLNAAVTPDDSTDSVVWISSNTAVATVSDGVITAVGSGSATISARAGSRSASCAVTVTDPTPAIYDVTPNINGGASKLYEPWGLRYYAVFSGADIDKISDRGIAILKETYYHDGLTAEQFCRHEEAHVFLDSRNELTFEAATSSNPNGRYYATLTKGIYSYDIGSKYYVVPFAVMNDGQILYGAIKKNSMENILKANLNLSTITATEKAICTCILELQKSVAAHYEAVGVPGASVDMNIPRGSSQSAASVKSTSESGITPNVVGGASRLIEPWGLRYFATYTESADIAQRGMVILSEKYYQSSYSASPDQMRLNANAYVFRDSDGTLLSESGSGRYYGTVTEGISSKDISDVYYVVPFVVLDDGSYVYGTVKSNSMMKIMNANLKSSSVPATERAVSEDIIDLYNAVKAYYAAQ